MLPKASLETPHASWHHLGKSVDSDSFHGRVFQNWAFAAFAIFSNQTSSKALLCTSWWLYPVFRFWEAASPCWPHNMEPSKATWKAGNLSACESPFIFLLSCSDRWIRTSKMVVFQDVRQNRENQDALHIIPRHFPFLAIDPCPCFKQATGNMFSAQVPLKSKTPYESL